MPPADTQNSRSVGGSTQGTEIPLLARTMFHDFTKAGYQAREIITFATELLDLVISSLRHAKSDSTAPRELGKAQAAEGARRAESKGTRRDGQ